jgi:hypothetical protein
MLINHNTSPQLLHASSILSSSHKQVEMWTALHITHIFNLINICRMPTGESISAGSGDPNLMEEGHKCVEGPLHSWQ